MAGEQQAATALAPPDPAVPLPGEGYQAREGMAAYFVAVVFKMSAGSNFARSPFSCGRGELCLFDPSTSLVLLACSRHFAAEARPILAPAAASLVEF